MIRTQVRSIPTADPTQQCCFCAHYFFLEFFDVKFYPYDPEGADPVFAAVSKKHVRRLCSRPRLSSRLFCYAARCDRASTG